MQTGYSRERIKKIRPYLFYFFKKLSGCSTGISIEFCFFHAGGTGMGFFAFAVFNCCIQDRCAN